MSYEIKLIPAGGSDSNPFKFDFKSDTNDPNNDYSDWLESGQLISSYVIAADSGLTISNDSITDTGTTVTFYPTATVAGTYNAICTITTNDSPARTKTRCMTFVVEAPCS